MNEGKCKVCTSTAGELNMIKNELALQKKEITKSINKLAKMDDDKCNTCTSTANELETVRKQLTLQKNDFQNSIRKLKERYDDTKCRECTSTIKELEKVKTELASQKDGLRNLKKLNYKMGGEMQENTSRTTSKSTKTSSRTKQPQTVQKSSKSKAKELSDVADNVEDKLSKLRITVGKDERKGDGASFEHLRKQNERIWDTYQIRTDDKNSPGKRYTKYLEECNLKTGEKLSQLKDEIDDIAGNLEWYTSRGVERKAKSAEDIPSEQNRIEAALQRRFAKKNMKEGRCNLPHMSIT